MIGREADGENRVTRRQATVAIDYGVRATRGRQTVCRARALWVEIGSTEDRRLSVSMLLRLARSVAPVARIVVGLNFKPPNHMCNGIFSRLVKRMRPIKDILKRGSMLY